MTTLYEYIYVLNDSDPGPFVDSVTFRAHPVQQMDDRVMAEIEVRVGVNRVLFFVVMKHVAWSCAKRASCQN